MRLKDEKRPSPQPLQHIIPSSLTSCCNPRPTHPLLTTVYSPSPPICASVTGFPDRVSRSWNHKVFLYWSLPYILRQRLLLNLNLTFQLDSEPRDFSVSACLSLHNAGVTVHTVIHAKLLIWMLGIWTQFLMLPRFSISSLGSHLKCKMHFVIIIPKIGG